MGERVAWRGANLFIRSCTCARTDVLQYCECEWWCFQKVKGQCKEGFGVSDTITAQHLASVNIAYLGWQKPFHTTENRKQKTETSFKLVGPTFGTG